MRTLVQRSLSAPRLQQTTHLSYGRRTALRTCCSTRIDIDSDASIIDLKDAFYKLVEDTERGGNTTAIQRGQIEERLVEIEGRLAGRDLRWDLLEGKWNVVYTTARDVRGIVRGVPEGFPVRALHVGQVYSCPATGKVLNVIQVELQVPILKGTRVSILVEADYAITNLKSIGLRFKAAQIGKVELGEGLQNLLTPAILPRGNWNLAAVNFVRNLGFQLNFYNPERGDNEKQDSNISSSLDITVLDDDMLVGRAQGGGGIYAFKRDSDANLSI